MMAHLKIWGGGGIHVRSSVVLSMVLDNIAGIGPWYRTWESRLLLLEEWIIYMCYQRICYFRSTEFHEKEIQLSVGYMITSKSAIVKLLFQSYHIDVMVILCTNVDISS